MYTGSGSRKDGVKVKERTHPYGTRSQLTNSKELIFSLGPTRNSLMLVFWVYYDNRSRLDSHHNRGSIDCSLPRGSGL